MPYVRDPNGNVMDFPEDLQVRFARMIRARTVSYIEARDMIQELLHHMEPRDKDRLIKDMYKEIERYYHNMPLNQLHQEMSDYDIARMAMPLYKFRVENGKIVDGSLEVDWTDKTTRELDELLKEETRCFLSKQEMEL